VRVASSPKEFGKALQAFVRLLVETVLQQVPISADREHLNTHEIPIAGRPRRVVPLTEFRHFLEAAVLGQDASFAWRHLQMWVEFYEARFQVPRVGDADTFAYYIEAKYKFTPQFFGAIRWNQQLFGDVSNGSGQSIGWSPDLARIDIAVAYRFTSHTQLKLQYDYQHETTAPGDDNHLLAAQFTVRF